MALARRPSNANASFFHGVTVRGVCSFVVVLMLIGVVVEQEHRIVASSSSNTKVKSRSTMTKEEKQKQRRQQRQELKEKLKENSEIQSCPNSNPLLIPNEHKMSDKAIFFHMGKAAGGTIFKGGIQCNWRMVFDQCHPRPCVNGEEKGKMVLINMRDPVDRFISSFYWEMHRHCSEGDTRKNCLQEERDGYKAVVHTYKKDPNKLAKDLCSSNKKTFRKAQNSLRSINHVGYDIADWLKPEFLEPKYQDSVYPIIMDASVDVMEQTDKAAAWLHNTTSFEDPADFFQRKKLVRKVRKRAEGKNSTKFVHHASGSDENALTPENEACLVQFYENEYKLLSKVKSTLCKNNLCKTAIKAILDRRSDALKSGGKDEDDEEEDDDDDNNDSDDEDDKNNNKSNDKSNKKKNKNKKNRKND